uniref:Uncharacterized protein LOC105852996 n=1 Tax=Cicer arietinum TaxID=3827 RepID=A0A1S3EKE2_CICAR|nr:uncharacterized protein LOC105852996 [Cicer arietinum]
MMANLAIIELKRNSDKVVEEIVKLERKIFPKHELIASFFFTTNSKRRPVDCCIFTLMANLPAMSCILGLLPFTLPSPSSQRRRPTKKRPISRSDSLDEIFSRDEL